MTDFQKIYRSHADEYEYLIAHEDYEGNVLKALLDIRPFDNLTVVEMGAGTGRLTRLLAPFVKQIIACDIAPAMLAVARQQLQPWPNWETAVCDNRALAIKNNMADVVIAGWSFGHFTGWHPNSWRQEIGQALAEMQRVMRPNGTLIILETMGTNQSTPNPPAPGLADYYSWLEQDHGFQSRTIRTDYKYPTVADAVESARFFFGDEMAKAVAQQNSPIIPECTGIWCLTS